jgi:autotransporter adhesin
MDDRFRTVNNRVDSVGAMGAAMAQMAFSTQGINSPNRLGVGVGGYHNQAALAVGYSRQISSHASLTFGAAVSGSETSGGMGLGVGW